MGKLGHKLVGEFTHFLKVAFERRKHGSTLCNSTFVQKFIELVTTVAQARFIVLGITQLLFVPSGGLPFELFNISEERGFTLIQGFAHLCKQTFYVLCNHMSTVFHMLLGMVDKHDAVCE